MSARDIKVYQNLMGENEKWAGHIRALRRSHGIAMLNLIGSPGSGKTALLEAMVHALGDMSRIAVLEGDVATTNDARRLDELDVTVAQLLSNGACHLEAKLVHRAMSDLDLDALDMVIVENVGNLVCPAEFDVGEDAKVAVLSVTEGEDKPLKYPLLFQEAGCAIVSKIDLVPHLEFDIDACRANIGHVNPRIPVFSLSSRSGEGMQAWLSWIREKLDHAQSTATGS
jgi:hydrogenase nickel incorporation protein HypB